MLTLWSNQVPRITRWRAARQFGLGSRRGAYLKPILLTAQLECFAPALHHYGDDVLDWREINRASSVNDALGLVAWCVVESNHEFSITVVNYIRIVTDED